MFLGHVHAFRALAIFFIVAGHSIDFFEWAPDQAQTERLLRIIFSNGTILFVFIAGYLFQHLLPKYSTRKYYIAKLKFVILPYVLVSIPAIVVFTTLMHREAVWDGFYDNDITLQVIYFYLTGMHLAPLWFIPMIALFYLAAPVLSALDKHPHFYSSLPVWLLVSCLVDRGWPLQSFVHFFSVYLLGMFCSHYKDRIDTIISKAPVLLLMLSLMLTLIWIEFSIVTDKVHYLNLLQKLLASLLVLGLFFRYRRAVSFNPVDVIAEASFGVFFIHSYVLTAGKMGSTAAFGERLAGNLLFYGGLSVAVLVLCVLMVSAVKAMFGNRSRYLIGS